MKLHFDTINKGLNENGFYVLDSYLEKSEVENLLVEFEELISKDHVGAQLTPYSEGKCVRIFKHEYEKAKFPKTTELFYNESFERISAEYLQEAPNLNETIFAVKDVVGSKHIANDLHYDVLKTLKFFVYLTDTTVKNGAFTCVPGSHKRTLEYRKEKGDEISFDNRYLSRELDVDDFPPEIPIEGKAGTLIIFDTDVWHRAGIVSEGDRKVMRGHTRPLSRLDKNAEISEPKNNMFSKIFGKFRS